MKFELAYPVKPIIVNQAYGVKNPYYKEHGINIEAHNGEDYHTVHGQPVFAAHDGVASWEIDDKGGWGVVIRTEGQFEYKDGQAYFKTIYWHLCTEACHNGAHKIAIKNSQKVKVGDLIGYADSTGLSTGDHLHFGLKAMKLIKGVFHNIEQNNGQLGAIDPKPYFNGTYAVDVKITLLTQLISLAQKLLSILSQARH
jgi:murein DD-endopeptidase MepM/ murein hydrolase activator NlpD